MAAAAALPAAVQVCEALGVSGGSKLRATVEWQLAGQLGAVTALPPAEALLGTDNAFGQEISPAVVWPTMPTKQTAAAKGIAPEHALDLLVVEGVPAVGRWAVRMMLQSLPHWTTVLSCALVLLVGAVINV